MEIIAQTGTTLRENRLILNGDPIYTIPIPVPGTTKTSKGVFDKRTNTTTDIWLTPPNIIKALGEFDLDPCSPINRPWDTAKRHYDINDDGLRSAWEGRVWLNPPYGRQLPLWLKRLTNHGNGIALIFARTETRYFHDYIWNRANAVFFFKGRIRFLHIDGTQAGSSAAPSCLIAYGANNVTAIRESNLEGKLVELIPSSETSSTTITTTTMGNNAEET